MNATETIPCVGDMKERALNILGDLDLLLMTDLYCPENCAKCATEVDHQGDPCYYVGWPEDLSAGIYAGHSCIEGNLFVELEQAYAWVINNKAALNREFPEGA